MSEGFALTSDIVLIAQDHVLLVQRRWEPFEGFWALPGGYVETDKHETALVAAYRELAEETSIDLCRMGVPLRQVGFYDRQGRDPRGDVRTVAHFARLPELVEAKAQDDAKKVRWCRIDALPALAFDHAEILADTFGRAAA